jgi:membrane fusion protein (multidrug efflux system)
MQARLDARDRVTAAQLRGETDNLFREEALAHHRAGDAFGGALLDLTSRWTAWVTWLLLGVVVAGGLFVALGSVHQYAEGPAVVRAIDRDDVTASFAGTLDAVLVQPGQAVRRGAPLVRFNDAVERAELAQLDKAFELQLIQRLRDPADPLTRQELTRLHAQRQLAQARLRARTVLAPIDAMVSDVRVHPGQHVNAGDVLVSLAGPSTRYAITALLPGEFRPQLAPGMPMRVELVGYDHTYQTFVVNDVAEGVVGPQEARRALGSEIADSVALQGPVVLLRAATGDTTFQDGGLRFQFHDGMLGQARVRVRAESLLFTLLPALKALGASDDGP